MEKRKDIKGYEGLYQVSSQGNIYSKPRWKTKGGLLKPNILHGYERVVLCKEGKVKNYAVHRLVAKAFIPNPNNYNIINHIDENKQNNNVTNLEWCTQAKNVQHSRKTGGILQLDLNNKVIKKWESALQAEQEEGFDNSAIIKCCRGKRKTHKGYQWGYNDETT